MPSSRDLSLGAMMQECDEEYDMGEPTEQEWLRFEDGEPFVLER